MLKKVRSRLNLALGMMQTFLRETPDEYEKVFIAHNRQIWSGYRSDRSRGQILVEENRMGGCTVGMSYVASCLGRLERAKLVAFTKGVTRAHKLVYKSFVDEFLFYSGRNYEAKVESVFADIFSTIVTKKDLEELKVNGIWIGDLIYDLFIRKLNTTTVDLGSQEFPCFLREALGYLFFWQDYFSKHTIKAVLVSHCVYPWAGIITRVAVSFKVPVYLIQPNRIYYVTNNYNARAYNQYIDYPKQFEQLSIEEKEKRLLEAKERIARRFRGERDVGGHHLIKPTYKEKTGERVLKENAKIKILVASHCFSDDNHVYGNNLFPDFYEWLCFLGEMSGRTDYDWYLKLHPDHYHWEKKHIVDFVHRFPKFTILSSDTSHHQIIEDGVSCVLTVYGTIGFEYAALGVPVITAADWNPTVAYDFNLHPKSIQEYEQILLHLDEIKLEIDLSKVYEYYFCQYLDEPDNWLYDSFTRLDAEIGGREAHIGSLSYGKYLEQFSIQKHESILATIERFRNSGDYCLRPCHVAN